MPEFFKIQTNGKYDFFSATRHSRDETPLGFRLPDAGQVIDPSEVMVAARDSRRRPADVVVFSGPDRLERRPGLDNRRLAATPPVGLGKGGWG